MLFDRILKIALPHPAYVKAMEEYRQKHGTKEYIYWQKRE
jgi:hypothetical protein